MKNPPVNDALAGTSIQAMSEDTLIFLGVQFLRTSDGLWRFRVRSTTGNGVKTALSEIGFADQGECSRYATVQLFMLMESLPAVKESIRLLSLRFEAVDNLAPFYWEMAGNIIQAIKLEPTPGSTT